MELELKKHLERAEHHFEAWDTKLDATLKEHRSVAPYAGLCGRYGHRSVCHGLDCAGLVLTWITFCFQ